MARGERKGSPKRADRVLDHELLEELLRDGLTGPQVVAEYQKRGKGHVALNTVYSLRHHLDLPANTVQHLELLPWKTKEEHANRFPARMLRLESRHRRGETLRPTDEAARARFLRFLEREGVVVHYDSRNELAHHGWLYVEKRDGIDTDIIRNPWRDDHGRAIAKPRGLRPGAADLHNETESATG